MMQLMPSAELATTTVCLRLSTGQLTSIFHAKIEVLIELRAWPLKPGQTMYNNRLPVTFRGRQFVCRDMAHLGIACCRALSIPARMVVGYFERLQPMDLHAWFEAYVGGRWYTFDPTQDNLQGGRVAIAYGRDTADVAIYSQFGDPVELLRMDVTVARMSPPSF
jgi:hypothetical protein